MEVSPFYELSPTLMFLCCIFDCGWHILNCIHLRYNQPEAISPTSHKVIHALSSRPRLNPDTNGIIALSTLPPQTAETDVPHLEPALLAPSLYEATHPLDTDDFKDCEGNGSRYVLPFIEFVG